MRHLPCQDYSKHLNVKSFNPHNNLIFPAFRMWEERSPRPKATGQVHGPQQAGELQGPHPCSASPATPHSGWLSLAGAGAGGGGRCMATRTKCPFSILAVATVLSWPQLWASCKVLLLLPTLSQPASLIHLFMPVPVGHTSLRVINSKGIYWAN